MMPNMMPKVGRGSSPCVFYNTGHGHRLDVERDHRGYGWRRGGAKLGRPAPVASGQTAVA